MGYWDWYPKTKPRRPANGIKAQTQHGTFGKSWWAGRWLAALERLIDSGRLARGRSYARNGQVLTLDIQPGRVISRVQGSRRSPYNVQIDIKPLTEKEWGRVAGAMAEQAIFAAKLLAGEMPQNIQEAFAAAKLNLFPTSRNDLRTECSCPDSSNPCKHIAAVYYLLGEQFDADPFLLFRLRGKGKDEIMTLLRTRRTVTAAESRPAETPAEGTPRRRKSIERGEPLARFVDRYWEAPDHLADLAVTMEESPVDAAPVKRLGAPGFWRDDQVDFVALCARAYRELADAAKRSALGTRRTRE